MIIKTKMKAMRNLRIVLGLALVSSSAFAQDNGLTDMGDSRYAQMCNTPLGAVEWTDGFWGDRFKVFSETSLTSMWDTWNNPDISHGFRNFEIGKAGVTKIEGIRELCKILDVPMEQTMAIGDSENDYSMINAAGIGVAMANASDDILAIADYITTSNTEDGVGEAIKHFIP